jgi:sulfite exporter TauE/SafE
MLYTALILGMVSSLHCIGMCGPIAMMLPVNRSNPTVKALQILLYHAGRLTAYGSLGLLFGLLGRGLYLAGMQQEFSIITGIIMIAMIMIPEKKLAEYNFSKPVYKVIANIKAGLGAQFKKRNLKTFYITGILNGYLPCGLVYAALFGALAMQDTAYGMFYMILYGMGTVPLMSIIVYSASFLRNNIRTAFSRLVPYMVVFVGMLFIVRGLGMDIPYISPSNLNLYVQQAPICK